MKFPDLLRFSLIFSYFSPRHSSLRKDLFFLNVATTYHWSSVYRNTNLLLIHLPKVKPPHIATPTKAIYISPTFCLSIHCWKISPIWNFYHWFWLKTLVFPDFPDCKKFSKFSLIGENPDNRAVIIFNKRDNSIVLYILIKFQIHATASH